MLAFYLLLKFLLFCQCPSIFAMGFWYLNEILSCYAPNKIALCGCAMELPVYMKHPTLPCMDPMHGSGGGWNSTWLKWHRLTLFISNPIALLNKLLSLLCVLQPTFSYLKSQFLKTFSLSSLPFWRRINKAPHKDTLLPQISFFFLGFQKNGIIEYAVVCTCTCKCICMCVFVSFVL